MRVSYERQILRTLAMEKQFASWGKALIDLVDAHFQILLDRRREYLLLQLEALLVANKDFPQTIGSNATSNWVISAPNVNRLNSINGQEQETH